MPIDAIAALLTLLAVALPFLFSVTTPPSTNVWPLLASWSCIALLGALAWKRALRSRRHPGLCDGGATASTQLALGLLLAAVVGGVICLVQYFGGDVGMAPWINASTPGQAVGNLRQRNQQATLVALGAWALAWSVAQWHVRTPAGASRRLPLPDSLVGLAFGMALTVLALASAATSSRTGAVQWLVIVVLLLWWRRSLGRMALAMALGGAVLYIAAAWLLPLALHSFSGVQAEGLFNRFSGDSHQCTSRRVLWSNVLTLIAQKPWTGWGWNELDYAHYITLFPGERFCVLLDNAHNLPLHLAVELGLPAAVLLCGAALAFIVKARPWSETDPGRQLAWGILALIGAHSMLEFPLWYGPFQLAALLALALLWPRRHPASQPPAPAVLGATATVLVAAVLLIAWTAHDYHRISQLYKVPERRDPVYRDMTPATTAPTLLFSDQVDFARLPSMALTRATAQEVYTLSGELLHYSPEPRVIEKRIESALMLGRDDEAAYHLRRYRIAYPKDHARWLNKELPASRAAGNSKPQE
ncbi:MAG: Wzy polymerase domain-containing protein [Pseudomonadota bacterium]